MVPFYGQGMNAGFEDCSLLSEIIDRNHTHFHAALKEFSDSRCEDAEAICDLAMYNYVEVCISNNNVKCNMHVHHAFFN